MCRLWNRLWWNGEIIKCDYPAKGEEVGRAVVNGDVDYGVLMCGTGIGISIAANKVPGVIAAVAANHILQSLQNSITTPTSLHLVQEL